MTRGCKHGHAFHRHRRPIRILAPGQVHAECLPGQRVPILQTRETHGQGRNAGKSGNLLGHPFGVRAAFFHCEQCMLATAIRSEAEHLINLEILGMRAHHALQGWSPVRARQLTHSEDPDPAARSGFANPDCPEFRCLRPGGVATGPRPLPQFPRRARKIRASRLWLP